MAKPGYTEERIEKLFGTHGLPPDLQGEFLELKAKFKELALHVAEVVPGCPHQTIAINKLIEAKDAACLGLITESFKTEED